MNKKLKKGFTLAELLIVVAIIAVLTAIAVPLFVTSLKKAEDSRDAANIRSLRSTAIVYILSVGQGDTDYATLYPSGNLATNGYVATGKIDGKGNFTEFKITVAASAEAGAAAEGVSGDVVTAYITAVDISTTSTHIGTVTPSTTGGPGAG